MNKIYFLILIVIAMGGCSTPTQTVAKLDFPLPRQARYTVTDQQFEAAKRLLQQNFSADTNKLNTIISSPCICGPGLWHLLKDSPRFSIPPHTKTTVKVPLANGEVEELPAALIQSKTEADNFRAALADLLSEDGDLTFRLPTEREFKIYWALTPFDEISSPLIVAEGTRYNLIIEFGKNKPFWFDEVKNMEWKQ
jgi:hypothetical protein